MISMLESLPSDLSTKKEQNKIRPKVMWLRLIVTTRVLATCVFIPRTSSPLSFPGTEGVHDPQSHVTKRLWAAMVLELCCQTVKVWNF